MSKKRVLFLCTGNSARRCGRSQMAEGLVNHFLGDRWKARSAGAKPATAVHPLAIRAMAELGIDISTQQPKSAGEFDQARFDLVVTLCDSAAQNCPLCLGWKQMAHIGFPDPVAGSGSEEERLAAFRRVRNGLKQEVFAYLERFEDTEPEEVKLYAP
ncbi:MAG: arsenate reductase ArsC [Anaerolineae bacterium]|nr:arsenate reductase ArsC [Anaerolineae bacterium]